MVVIVIAEIPGLQYYLFVIVALLLGSILYNLKQSLAMKKREATETALVKEAYFHPISELPNRKNIDIMITEQIHRVHRRDQSFLIVIIRIKNYSDVNMRSKSEGSEFISEAGTRVVDMVRDEDMVAHISDNTFAILFNEYLEENNYEILFKRLKNVFTDEFQITQKKSLIYDIGFGYSQYPKNGIDGDTLINKAIHQALK